jgi:hypothetical protein
MMASARSRQDSDDRSLDVQEIRLVSDLRIMHSKVDELHIMVETMKRWHKEADIVKYAHYEVLSENIRKVDEIYMWFVKVKEERGGS